MLLQRLSLLCTLSVGAAAVQTDIYSSGDLVVANPIESTVIFACVAVVSSMLEFGIDSGATIRQKYFRVMFAALNQEIMIVGILVIALTFAESVYDWPTKWILFFKWAMMTLFLMVISFILLILIMLFVVRRADSSWSHFEVERMDGAVSLSTRERQYKDGFNRFQTTLGAFGYNAGMGIRFSEYLSKLMRKNVVALTDLNWVSWICLATVVVINALRTEGFRQLSEYNDENVDDTPEPWRRVVNYLSFPLVVGYGALAGFLAMYILLHRRLNAFLAASETRGDASEAILSTRRTANQMDNLDDSRSFLFRHSLEVTLEMLQVVLLTFEWYFSTFLLTYAFPLAENMGLTSIPIFVAAVIPLIVVFALLPWLLMMITVLSSSGNNLDEATVQSIVRRSKVPRDELPPRMRLMLERQDARARQKASRVRLEVRSTSSRLQSPPLMAPGSRPRPQGVRPSLPQHEL